MENGIAEPNQALISLAEKGIHIQVGDWPIDILDQVVVVCRAMVTVDQAKTKLTRHLGEGLTWLRSNWDGDCQKQHGSFAKFLEDVLVEEVGVSRSTLYNSMKLHESFPSLSPEDWNAIGTSNLLILKQFTKEGEPSCQKLLDKAKGMTGRDLLEFAHNHGEINRNDVLRVMLVIPCSKETASYWKEFIHHPKVQATVGSTDEGQVLLRLMQECASEWMLEEPEGK
jgi:hypothetical protein